jgi:hypothetical protein
MRRLVFFVCVIALVCRGSLALAQPPAISVVSPVAVAPGSPSDLTLQGSNLAGVVGAWLSFGGQIEPTPGIEGNGAKPDQVTYRITVPAGTPVQIGGIRVATGQGVSNLRLVMIDDLPTVMDNGANKTIEAAQELSLPVAVEGTCEAESFDFYKFQAHAGQRVSVEVFARRLGSPLDPVIRLLDSAGKELAYSDDEGGASADCRFVHRFEADGQYLLEVRDIRYQGSGGHRYRMRIGDFPLTTVPVPMGARKGSTARIAVAGPAVAGVPAVEATIRGELGVDVLPVAFRYPQGQGSSFVTLAASSLAEQIEFEPNNSAEAASGISLPGAVTGRFAEPKDRDFYQFDVQAGQRYLFIGRTREFGSPTDLYLQLLKADGTVLAEADDNGVEEGLINYAFSEAGTYRLMVEDLHRRGGPEHAYRIEMVPYQPGFTLALEADKFNVPQGGVFAAKVTAQRFDYNGPIALALENGDGFTLAGNEIPEGKNETVLQATAASTLEPGQWRVTGILGRAKIGDAEFVARAATLPALKGQLGGLPYPPPVLQGLVAIGVGPVFPDFFKLNLASTPVRFPQLVGTTTFNVHAEKLNGFNDTIALAVEGLPSGFTAEVKPIEKDQAEAQVTLKGPATLSEAEYPFRIVGSATFQNQPKQVAVDAMLRVAPPLEVMVEFSGPVKSGESVKAKVRALRGSEEKGAVTIAWQNLPLGVHPPETTTIPQGQDEVEVALTTDPNSMIGAAHVQVTATTTVQGRNIRVESPPASLQVTMPE